ncbi:hypothetical protein M406DRAFT_52535 [Cryphonectria parasitica EP155]|uniref:CENP-V/GFA domain-containing protein n=1 Tax=Cryphonectria parasitica (strain ATCC 38755 / EP155) TaxID=660469 RepID=A0A9P4YA10_CRYP1|nr:uncharacterized protein M406DRAFT_52535 [Cryphonectria parasitica EP155]KAF3769226.1 hypothetical protein M406DRAFT_52535 [Cryphonectria parasitica EP155]
MPDPHYANNPSAFPMEGGCSCGHVRYRLETAPLAVHCCHCTACQRESGTAFTIGLLIEASNLSDGGGAELIRARIPQESGEIQTVSRCPMCFNAVWTEYASFGPHIKFVRGGTLDRAWLVQPDVHIYLKSKMDFFKFDDGKPQFEEYYDRTKVWRLESLERWAKVLPAIMEYHESK